jgi:predicted DCC family thiol-disulfide oxidoreductase YuxK
MSVRLPAALLLYLAGIGGLVVGGLVQFEPEIAAAFLPPEVDPALARTFLIADLLFLGLAPLVAARALIRGWDHGYAFLCVFAGATGFSAAWAWMAATTANAPLAGALISSPGPLLALWAAVRLRPGGPEPSYPRAAARTTPQEHLVVLFDGSCGFCRGSVARLERWAGPDRFEAVSLHDTVVPQRFPGVPHDALMRALHTVEPSGRVNDAVGAVLLCAARRPGFGWLSGLYRLPGLAVTVDIVYALVARYRQSLPGTTCKDGACAVQSPRPDSSQPTAKSTNAR